jgi:3-hydroxyacyl-[acyl-carrier-protein] dehydratase
VSELRLEFVVPATHPALAGHFPGRPIVPGALLLAEVLDVAAQAGIATCPIRLRRVKFTSPVRPGEVVNVTLRPWDVAGADFTCTVGERMVAAGMIEPLAKADASS